MTLKEKFKNIDELDKTWNQILEQQVKIADDYAIEFAEWIHNNCFYCDGWNVRVPLGDKYSDVYNIEELLEIFKKEKGL